MYCSYGFTDERLLQLALRHKSAGGATNNGALVRLGATLLPLLTASDEYAANPIASRKGANIGSVISVLAQMSNCAARHTYNFLIYLNCHCCNRIN